MISKLLPFTKRTVLGKWKHQWAGVQGKGICKKSGREEREEVDLYIQIWLTPDHPL